MSDPIARSASALPPLTLSGPASVNRLADGWGSDRREAPVVDRRTVDPELLKAAEGMEAVFLDQLMQVMRKTVPKDSLGLDSPATEIYQGMLDSEYATLSAQAGGVGLTDLIVAYMQQQRYTDQRPQGQAGRSEPGGKDAGQPIQRR